MDRAGVVPQLLGAAVGIVLGSALLFAVLGMLRDDEVPQPDVAAAPSASDDPTGSEASAPPTGDDASPAAAASDEPTTAESGSEPEETPSAEPEPTETEEPVAAPAEQVDPASVSIQVLDAVGGPNGSDIARAVADELREAGYDVIVVNRAGRSYDVTTVFWSEGQEAGGRQVAASLGTSRAEPTPTEVQLSDSVDVHVVVGADRA